MKPRDKAHELVEKFGDKALDVVDEILLVGLTFYQRKRWMEVRREIKALAVQQNSTPAHVL